MFELGVVVEEGESSTHLSNINKPLLSDSDYGQLEYPPSQVIFSLGPRVHQLLLQMLQALLCGQQDLSVSLLLTLNIQYFIPPFFCCLLLLLSIITTDTSSY